MTIMSLIVATAMGALVLLYSGLFKFIAREFEGGGAVVGAGILLGVACWGLCKHCDDLIDRRRI